MSMGKLVLASLRYHGRANLAVALAVMAAGAVLTGALLVGDSMRGSLRHLLLDQLGTIDEVLVTDRFFRVELADELARQPDFGEFFRQAVPAIYVPGTIEHPRQHGTLRAADITVIGSDARFWQLGHGGPAQTAKKGQIILNEPLARQLGARADDEVLLRIGSVSQIPPDSALGRKTETIRTRRLTVSAVIPAAGLGRFSLYPSQQQPLVAFVAIETLADALEQAGKANAIFVAGSSPRATSQQAHDALVRSFDPQIVDYGIDVMLHDRGYAQVTGNRLLLDPVAVAAIEKAFAAEQPQPLFTYLANTIAGNGREIPYSTITALDFRGQPPLGPFTSAAGQPLAALADDEIALNTWAAEDLGVKLGDEIEITYFRPESTHGEVRESKARFKLAAIVAMSPAASDPDLTPRMPGITDRASLGDWDAPFPFDASRVRKKDEQYWDEYHTAPKAFISLAAGRRLWSSRFGDTTSIRFAPPPGATAKSLAARLRLDPPELGFQFLPIKRMGLAAAAGTTPFDALFLGFSLFIMISALLLVALLFRLGIEQRAQEIGVLKALGLRQRQVVWALAVEAFVVTALAALAGAGLGVGYAWLMLRGLTTWWLDAIRTPFLQLHVTAGSLAIGYASGLIVCLLTILGTLRRLGHISVRRLLAGQTLEDRFGPRGRGGRIRATALGLVVLAAVAGCAAITLRGEAQAGAFVGCGTLVLAAGLTWLWGALGKAPSTSLAGATKLPIARLAARNGARNPARSVLSVGLIAAASFLIVALSAFRLDPASQSLGRASGGGGFTLIAHSDQPIYQDLNTPRGRQELGLAAPIDDQAKSANEPDPKRQLLSGCDVYSLRVRAGDDASCLNLYQSTQPRVLGASERLIARGGFAWAASAAQTNAEKENPWLLLNEKLPDDADGTPVIPAVLDFNTAEYSLHKGKIGETLTMKDDLGRDVRFRIVGLLKNSVLQGIVLTGERALLDHFPQVSGYRFFLIDTQGQSPTAVREALEGGLSDFGFAAQSTRDQLEKFFAVQNTYLATFQSLGGLGLLLGTFGLATVQLRNVLERRGELALMRAAGFRRALLARLVLIENTLLLLGGLTLGVVAALITVLPHWLGGGASVPWMSLAGTLGLVLVVGLLAGLVAVRAVLRAQLLPALREE